MRQRQFVNRGVSLPAAVIAEYKDRGPYAYTGGAVLKLIFQLTVFGLGDLTLLLILANYTSWQVALVEVLASGLLGLVVIRYVTAQFGHRVLSRLAASESPGPVLADGVILFVAGILLILPGIVSDLVGLLLLIPLVRRLTVAWLTRQLLTHRGAFRGRFVHSHFPDAPPTGEVILDGRLAAAEMPEDDGRPGCSTGEEP